jgi:NAD(P)-dependent dehydrogenase (short-subunit alcohol dehydrogenase family)
MEARLDDRILIVTGSTQGVGLAVATAAARSGAAGIMLTGRDAGKGEAAAAALAREGTATGFVAADLIAADAPDRIFDAALARFGRVDMLVNAAGITDRGSLLDATPAFWDRLFAANARAPFFLMQRLVTHLRDRKAPGAIVNVLSINAHGGTPSLAVYSATKAALALLTKNAAHSHRFDGIRVNGINMGWTDTPGERQMQAVTLGHGEDWLAAASAEAPFGRILTPADIAGLAIFLLSDAGGPMTGAVIDQEQWVIGPRDESGA